MGLRNIKNWNEFEEQITFEIWVDGIDENISTFSRFIADGATEEDLLSSNTNSTYRAFIALRKINEEDEELPEIRGTRHPSNRAERRKATAHAKKRRKAMATYADDEIRTNSGKVVNTGWRSYEKGNKLYTRKGRVTREKFMEEPVDEESVFTIRDTNLSLDINSEIWTDEEISQAVKKYHTPWYEKYGDYEEGYDFEYDPYQSALDDREAAWDEISDLKRQINIYKDFIGEFNLNTLYERWLVIR